MGDLGGFRCVAMRCDALGQGNTWIGDLFHLRGMGLRRAAWRVLQNPNFGARSRRGVSFFLLSFHVTGWSASAPVSLSPFLALFPLPGTEGLSLLGGRDLLFEWTVGFVLALWLGLWLRSLAPRCGGGGQKGGDGGFVLLGSCSLFCFLFLWRGLGRVGGGMWMGFHEG